MTIALLQIMNPAAQVGNRTLDSGPQASVPSEGLQRSDSAFAAMMGEDGARDGRGGGVVDGKLNEDAKRRAREDSTLCNQQGLIGATPELLRSVFFNEARRALSGGDAPISAEPPAANTPARDDDTFDKWYQSPNLPLQDTRLTKDSSYEELPHHNMIGTAWSYPRLESPAQRYLGSEINFIDTVGGGRDSNAQDTIGQRISGEQFASPHSGLLTVDVAKEGTISGIAKAGVPFSENDVSVIDAMNLNHSIDRQISPARLAPAGNQNADTPEALLGDSANASHRRLGDNNDKAQMLSSRPLVYYRYNPGSESRDSGWPGSLAEATQ